MPTITRRSPQPRGQRRPAGDPRRKQRAIQPQAAADLHNQLTGISQSISQGNFPTRAQGGDLCAPHR
jgi:hypothetical protein